MLLCIVISIILCRKQVKNGQDTSFSMIKQFQLGNKKWNILFSHLNLFFPFFLLVFCFVNIYAGKEKFYCQTKPRLVFLLLSLTFLLITLKNTRKHKNQHTEKTFSSSEERTDFLRLRHFYVRFSPVFLTLKSQYLFLWRFFESI